MAPLASLRVVAESNAKKVGRAEERLPPRGPPLLQPLAQALLRRSGTQPQILGEVSHPNLCPILWSYTNPELTGPVTTTRPGGSTDLIGDSNGSTGKPSSRLLVHILAPVCFTALSAWLV
mgnify:CR=1 FL=1